MRQAASGRTPEGVVSVEFLYLVAALLQQAGYAFGTQQMQCADCHKAVFVGFQQRFDLLCHIRIALVEQDFLQEAVLRIVAFLHFEQGGIQCFRICGLPCIDQFQRFFHRLAAGQFGQVFDQVFFLLGVAHAVEE